MTDIPQDKITMIRVNGQEKPALFVGQAITYLGVSRTALQNFLKENPHIKKYKIPFRKQETYLLLEDLDSMQEAQPVEEA